MVTSRSIRIALLMVAAAAAAAPAQQPMVPARVIPLQVTGDPAARFSLVILGDGYTAAELPKFRAHVDKHLNVLWSIEPFRSYRNYINVYAVEIASPVSGITCDPAHRERRDTPLGLNYSDGCTNPNARGIVLPQERAQQYAALATPHFDQILVIANTDTYGGIGGRVATTSGGNSLGPLITPHELGHSLGGLQDEYTYRERGVRGPAYTRAEPASVHHTLLTEEQMRTQQRKWWRWLGEESESGGVIGRYEGGMYHSADVFRPSRHSMMISLGYYFDQVSREEMVKRISAQVDLISASTPTDAPVGHNDTLWIETAHPVYHDLDVVWRIDNVPVRNAGSRTVLDLGVRQLSPGPHTVSVTVVDPTPFVRDPAIRDTVLTTTRNWRIADGARAPSPPVGVRGTTQTQRAVGANQVVYVETTQPVQWTFDGGQIGHTVPRFHLASLALTPGTHTLSAEVASERFSWRIDNTLPTVGYTLGRSLHSVLRPDSAYHHFARDSFTVKLEPQDDQPGYVVAEFRLNGDGWHHYYGWPDAPEGTPFLFTARGTTIKELVYGSLGAEGLSPQPWEARAPGWGTHRIEYRAIDAAGNIGEARAFLVTVLPSPGCTRTLTGTHTGDLRIASGVTCLHGTSLNGSLTVLPGASLVAMNARIEGDIHARGAAAVELVGATVSGAVQLEGTAERLILFGSRFARAVSVTGTAVPALLAGNHVDGVLTCSGNTGVPLDHGTPNSAARVSGDCAR